MLYKRINHKKCLFRNSCLSHLFYSLPRNLGVPFISTHTMHHLKSVLSSVVSSCPAPHLTFVLFDLYEAFGNKECFSSAFNKWMGSCTVYSFVISINRVQKSFWEMG